MLKKSLVLLSVFCLILFASSFVFASNIVNDTKNAMNDVGNGVERMVNDTKDGISNMKNKAENMTKNMGNDIEGSMSNNRNGNPNMPNDFTDDGYSATRTSATNNMTATNNTLVWIILIAAAVAVIALVWFYLAQTSDANNSRH